MLNNIIKTDCINIVLIILSLIFAIIFPFWLFLFSYAVFGPLHYLTEISWLHKKQYFLGKNEYQILVVVSIIMAIFFCFSGNINANSHFVFIVFALAAIMILIQNTWLRLISFLIALMIAFFWQNFVFYKIIFAIFLTTIIHVWFFTALFILSGAIKNKLFSGYLSLIIFLFCSVSFFLFLPEKIFGASDLKSIEIINNSGFDILNNLISQIFTFSSVKVQGFIAFSYTYHYLNWFSKVKIINWHQVPKKLLILLILLWIGSVGLYIYDYHLGLISLLFLSIIHVFLEFPLNFKVILTILKIPHNIN